MKQLKGIAVLSCFSMALVSLAGCHTQAADERAAPGASGANAKGEYVWSQVAGASAGAGAPGIANVNAPALSGAVLPTLVVAKVELWDGTAKLQRRVGVNPDGGYAVNVSALQGPFLLRASFAAETGLAPSLLSLGMGPSKCNINPVTNLAVVLSARAIEGGSSFDSFTNEAIEQMAARWQAVQAAIISKFQPLFDYYGVQDPFAGASEPGLREFFDVLRFDITADRVVISNPGTALQVFSGRLDDFSAGTLLLENLPPRRRDLHELDAGTNAGGDAGAHHHVTVADAGVSSSLADGGYSLEAEALFNVQCSGCHVVRDTDHDHSHGTIPNLASKGNLVAARFSAGNPGIGGGNAHTTITLTAEQIDLLVRYVDSFPAFGHAM
jgi:mono/diheme cytochrome c family protein